MFAKAFLTNGCMYLLIKNLLFALRSLPSNRPTRCRVGPRAGLDAMTWRISSASAGNRTTVAQLEAGYYTY
jgi:hypothetical protein